MKLIFHIGTDKTGTSSLQKFMKLNRDAFVREGIYLPPFSDERYQCCSDYRTGEVFRMLYDLHWFEQQYKQADMYYQDRAQFAQQVLDDTWTHAENAALFSDEMLYWWTAANPYGPEPSDYSLLWEFIASQLPDKVSEVELLVYLRSQDSYTVSGYKQGIVNGGRYASFSEECASAERQAACNYAATLERIERAFERAERPCPQVTVRRYEKDTFVGGSIYHDFCHALGIELSATMHLPRKEVNPSISYDLAEALRTSPIMIEQPHDKVKDFKRFYIKVFRHYVDPPHMMPFSVEEHEQFMNSFAACNQRISEKYLNGEPLFAPKPYTAEMCYKPHKLRIVSMQSVLNSFMWAYEFREAYMAAGGGSSLY